MKVRWIALVAMLVLAASACSKSKTSTSGTPTGSAGSGSSPAAAALTVNVDGKAPANNEAFLAYFPATATVKPGGSVSFNLVDSGEPHTVTFGSLAETDIAANAKDPTGQSPAVQAADAALPPLLPQGPGPANPSGANPCAVTTGPVPTNTACSAAQSTLAPFAGSEEYYNSGWLAPGKPFTLTLASDIKPGAYHYMCLLHGASMSGTIVVAGPSDTVPPAATQEAQGTTELQQHVAALADAASALEKGIFPPIVTAPKTNTVIAGSGTQTSNDLVTEFGPKIVTTTVGSTVTWDFLGPHTVSFNAPSSAYNVKLPGKPEINQQSGAPVGTAGQKGPPGGTNPNAAPGIGEVVNGGKYDGTAFTSSGTIISFPPSLTSYTLTFTKAGTFQYACLIHPGMVGTVVVQ